MTEHVSKYQSSNPRHVLGNTLGLPCGAVLKNRLAKSAMSDSLGNGEGDPTKAQARLYERWAEGGAAVSVIGEVQSGPHFPEKPGNLVFGADSDKQAIQALVSLARAMVLNPRLPQIWLTKHGGDPDFPVFESPPRGGVTAWYTMRLTALAEDNEDAFTLDPQSAKRVYEERDAQRCIKWRKKFLATPDQLTNSLK